MKRIILFLLLLPAMVQAQDQTIGSKNNTVKANGKLNADSGTYSKGVPVLTQADSALYVTRYYLATHGGGGGGLVSSFASRIGDIVPQKNDYSSYFVGWTDTARNGKIAAKYYVDSLLALVVPSSRTINGYALSSNITLSKVDVGLGNVDNTTDLNKPISTSTQTALNLKLNISDSGTGVGKYVTNTIAKSIAANKSLSGISFNIANGNISISQADGTSVITNLDNRYAFTSAANGDTLFQNIVLSGCDPTGVNNSIVGIQAAKATGKHLYSPTGATYRFDTSITDYLVCQLNANQNFYGNNCKFKTTSDITLLAAGDFSQITNVDGNGSGRGVTNKPHQTFIFSNGKRDVRISGCHAYGIAGTIKRAANKPAGAFAFIHQPFRHTTASLSDVHATACNNAIALGDQAEYITIVGGSLDSNVIAFYTSAGNYNFDGFSGQFNDTAVWIDSGTNNGHGAVSNSILKHSGWPLRVDYVNISYPTLFSNVDLTSGSTGGKIYLNNSSNLFFTGCTFAQDTTYSNATTGLYWTGGGRYQCYTYTSNGGADYLTGGSYASGGGYAIAASTSSAANVKSALLSTDALTADRIFSFPDQAGTMVVNANGTVSGYGTWLSNSATPTVQATGANPTYFTVIGGDATHLGAVRIYPTNSTASGNPYTQITSQASTGTIGLWTNGGTPENFSVYMQSVGGYPFTITATTGNATFTNAILLNGGTGKTLQYTNSITAPSTTSSPSFTSYFGGGTSALGTPTTWFLVKVAGTEYKVPAY